MIKNVVPGEIVPAHIFHRDEYEEEMENRFFIHFFIYRDPRDVVISEAHYYATMNRWHRMHSYFSSLRNLDEQILTAITGVSHPGFRYDYPNVAERFSRYRGWL